MEQKKFRLSKVELACLGLIALIFILYYLRLTYSPPPEKIDTTNLVPVTYFIHLLDVNSVFK